MRCLIHYEYHWVSLDKRHVHLYKMVKIHLSCAYGEFESSRCRGCPSTNSAIILYFFQGIDHMPQIVVALALSNNDCEALAEG